MVRPIGQRHRVQKLPGAGARLRSRLAGDPQRQRDIVEGVQFVEQVVVRYVLKLPTIWQVEFAVYR